MREEQEGVDEPVSTPEYERRRAEREAMRRARLDEALEGLGDLEPPELEAVRSWAAEAPLASLTLDAARDVVAASRLTRAARLAGGRYIPSSRTVQPGATVLEVTLTGQLIERDTDLSPEPLTAEEWRRVRSADAGPDEAARVVAAVRDRAVDNARAGLVAHVSRIEVLLDTLPAADRQATLEDAARRLANPSSSPRKLEKQLRQRVLRDRVTLRTREVEATAPDLRIRDLHGTVRVEAVRNVELAIAGIRMPVRLLTGRSGGELERLFLTGSLDDFVERARRVMADDLDEREAQAAAAAGAIEDFVSERRGWPFYNARALDEIVAEELRRDTELDTEDLLARLRFRTRRLDTEAREKEHVRRMVREYGLIAYKDYFPQARAMGRTLTLFVGPTNSGKTWHALNALADAESGVYLAPLRLLALEGQEEIEKRGRTSSYLTGEERDIRPDARFLASTIEMLDPQQRYAAAVIDEVQLLTDRDRGWAWCQALVGVAAERVYMTGSLDCIPVVQAIADYLGEPLEIVRLERFTPIEAFDAPVKLSDVEAGTAVVAFSRRDVLALKAELEGRFPVAVIYGNLTPEVRREEARRFRSGEAKLLVSTDAIAMGLNLPIRTILFSTLQKWNGREEVQLAAAEILQIGGRAGRYGKHERGHVGALDHKDVGRLQQVFAPGFTLRDRPVETQVRPSAGHIEAIAAGLDTDSLERVLRTFQRGMTFDTAMFSPGVTDDMIALAAIVDRHPEIPIAERLTLACAPIDVRSPVLLAHYENWIASYANERRMNLEALRPQFRNERATDDRELHDAEMEAKRLTAYAWLAYRYVRAFPDLAECQEQRAALDRFIEQSLSARAPRKKCRNCGRTLPVTYRHKLCDKCHNRGRVFRR